jgi:hypothetical protein
MNFEEYYKKHQGDKARIIDIDGQVFEGYTFFDTDYETDKNYVEIHYDDQNYVTSIFEDEIASIELI